MPAAGSVSPSATTTTWVVDGEKSSVPVVPLPFGLASPIRATSGSAVTWSVAVVTAARSSMAASCFSSRPSTISVVATTDSSTAAATDPAQVATVRPRPATRRPAIEGAAAAATGSSSGTAHGRDGRPARHPVLADVGERPVAQIGRRRGRDGVADQRPEAPEPTEFERALRAAGQVAGHGLSRRRIAGHESIQAVRLRRGQLQCFSYRVVIHRFLSRLRRT